MQVNERTQFRRHLQTEATHSLSEIYFFGNKSCFELRAFSLLVIISANSI